MAETTEGRSGARRSTRGAYAKLGQLMASDPESARTLAEAGNALAEHLSRPGEPTRELREEATGVVLVAWHEGRLREGLPEVPR